MLALVFATSREAGAALGPGHAGVSEGRWKKIRVHGRSCLQVVTGIGPLNAAFVFGRALGTHPGLSGVISMGIGGSFDLATLPLGSWTVADEEIWPEFGIRHEKDVRAQELGFPLGHAGNEAIWDRISLDPADAAARMALCLPPSMPRASFISVAGVTATRERADFLHGTCQADVENMEGFALALACATHGIPFLEIRTISNLVGPRDRATWQIKKACRALGDILPALFADTLEHTRP